MFNWMFLRRLGVVMNWSGALVLLFFSDAVLAQPQSVEPWQTVSESSQHFIQTIDALRAERKGAAITEEMVNSVLDSLTPIVDFGGIATAVMGSFSGQATADQMVEFSHVFKVTMARLYLNSLLNFDISRINVEPAPAGFDPASGRASVQITAIDSKNNEYLMRYSLRTNQDGEWRILNIIVEGVNLGLTYMNQFDSAMQRYGSIDRVIANWQEEAQSVDTR